MAINSDLKRACAALAGKRATYTNLWNYYRGEQPVVYTNRRLEDIFRDVDARFTENWCAVVIDSVRDRLQLTGFSIEDEASQDSLDQMWASLDLSLEAIDTHLGSLVCGEAFLIIWLDDQGLVQCYYNEPRLCHCFYDAENPRQMSFAAKWWDTDDGKRRLTLYYPDRLEYYVSKGKAENVSSASAFIPWEMPTAENPFSRIPVFHFRTDRAPVSEIANVVPLQNGINKLLIDMMVAAEYGAFRQRWVISSSDTLGKLRNAPNEIWDIPAGDGIGQQTQVGEFNATDLGNYLSAINNLAEAIGVITRTPRHYFFSSGGDPSGEALIAMETPLNKKVQRLVERFTPTWQEVAQFLLEIGTRLIVAADDVTPIFARSETVQPFTQAQVRQLEVSAGIPLQTSLRREGWSQSELEQMEKDAAAAAVSGEQLGDRLLSAFEAGK